jgi:beta-mannosidase
VARELAPFTVGMTRKAVKTFASRDSLAYFTISSVLEIWGTNSSRQEKNVCLELNAYNVEAGTPVPVTAEGWKGGKREVTLAPNASTELWKGQTPGVEDVRVEGMRSKPIVIQARLVDIDTDVVLARYSNWYALPSSILSGLNCSFKARTFQVYSLPNPCGGELED